MQTIKLTPHIATGADDDEFLSVRKIQIVPPASDALFSTAQSTVEEIELNCIFYGPGQAAIDWNVDDERVYIV